jgi:DNA-binding NarL/FixJ family response regulator
MRRDLPARNPKIGYKCSEEALRLSGYEASTLRVVIVDDHDLVRRAVRQTLNVPDVDVVAEAPDGETAIDLVTELAPDVVVMDLGLPGISGIEATQRLATIAPVCRVLVLTGSGEEHDVVDAIMAGACGYLIKDATSDEILDAVRAAAAGQSVIDRSVAGRLLAQIRGQTDDAGPGDAIRAALTDREIEVLKLVAVGKENNQIAEALFISPKTVQNHISSILAKLQLQNRIQAAVHAVRGGIV